MSTIQNPVLRGFKPDPRTGLALQDMNVSVPDDVAVAEATVVDIPGVDAGIEQNSAEIGKVAAESLIALINANDLGAPAFPRRILVEGSWIDGKTMPNRSLAPPDWSPPDPNHQQIQYHLKMQAPKAI